MTDLRKTATEIRAEVLEGDNLKDVSIYVVMPIAVIAALSSIAALCAMIMMRALVYFRLDVDAYFLTCAPFLFPVITGLFSAYKKQFSLLSVHLTTTLMALLLGGFGLGMSIEPIVLNRELCLPATPDLQCNKPILSNLYLICGCLAAGLSVIGVLATFLGIYMSSGRITVRKQEALFAHLHDVEEHQRQLRLMSSHDVVLKRRARAMSRSSADHHYISHIVSLQKEVNGLPKVGFEESILEDLSPKSDRPNSSIAEEEETTQEDTVSTKL